MGITAMSSAWVPEVVMNIGYRWYHGQVLLEECTLIGRADTTIARPDNCATSFRAAPATYDDGGSNVECINKWPVHE